MSTSGIRNNGQMRPVTPKEIIPDKKKSEKAKSSEGSKIQDSFKISDDGLKLDKVLKELSNVKSFLNNTSVDSDKLFKAAASGLSAEIVKDEISDVSKTAETVLNSISKDPESMEKAHGNLKAENVLALEMDSINELTEVFEIVESFIAKNPDKALGAQGNLE